MTKKFTLTSIFLVVLTMSLFSQTAPPDAAFDSDLEGWVGSTATLTHQGDGTVAMSWVAGKTPKFRYSGAFQLGAKTVLEIRLKNTNADAISFRIAATTSLKTNYESDLYIGTESQDFQVFYYDLTGIEYGADNDITVFDIAFRQTGAANIANESGANTVVVDYIKFIEPADMVQPVKNEYVFTTDGDLLGWTLSSKELVIDNANDAMILHILADDFSSITNPNHRIDADTYPGIEIVLENSTVNDQITASLESGEFLANIPIVPNGTGDQVLKADLSGNGNWAGSAAGIKLAFKNTQGADVQKASAGDIKIKSIKFVDLASLSSAAYEKSIGFSMYPNPSKNYINITSNEEIGNISIRSVEGRILKSFTPKSNTIDVSGLDNGIYLMELTMNTNNQRIIKKFIKQ